MPFRKHIIDILASGPRTASSLARELGIDRRDIEQDLHHLVRSARAAGDAVVVQPARCKACGFVFEESRLTKPGRCPQCKGTRLFEPLIRIEKR